MFGMVLRFICSALVISAVFAADCSILGDGVHEVGCKSFVTCHNGVEYVTECPLGQVFNNNTNTCDWDFNVGPPCGLYRDCTNKADGRYPDFETKCESYYTCHNGYYYGHNNCPSPLVWDTSKNICNYKDDTCQPCGTKADSDVCPWPFLG